MQNDFELITEEKEKITKIDFMNRVSELQQKQKDSFKENYN